MPGLWGLNSAAGSGSWGTKGCSRSWRAPCPQARLTPHHTFLKRAGVWQALLQLHYQCSCIRQPPPAALPSSRGWCSRRIPRLSCPSGPCPSTGHRPPCPQQRQALAWLQQRTLFTLFTTYFAGWLNSKPCTYVPLPSLVCSSRAGIYFTLIFHS